MNFRLSLISFFILILTFGVFGQHSTLRKKPIKKVEITGNRAFSEGKIKGILYTQENKWYKFLSKKKYSESDVRYDIEQIKRFYGRNGYPFTEVTSEVKLAIDDTSKVSIAFHIMENHKVYIRSLELSGGLTVINAKLQDYFQRFKTGEPLNTEAVKATVFRIKNLYAENAYPVADIIYNYRFTDDSSYVDVEFVIDPSKYVLNGDVEIVRESSSKSKDYILRRELVVERDKPYDRRKVIESQQRLYSTGLLKFVTLRRTLELTDIGADSAVTNFRLVVNERDSYFINTSIGAGQDEDFGAVFSTSISGGNRNLWGTGRKLILTASNSLQFTRRGAGSVENLQFNDIFSGDLRFLAVKNSIELDYVEPWFLGYRMPLSLSTIYEPSNKNPIINKYYDQVTGEMSLSRELDPYTNISVSGRVEFVDIHDVRSDEQALYRQQGDNSIRRRISLYSQRDTRDNIIAPQRGIFSYASLDYVGDLLGGDFSYIKGEFYWSNFQRLSGDNVLATRVNFGVLEELETGGSSSDDRFTLGGAKTVRGFSENDMGVKWGLADGVDSTQSLFGQPKGGKLMMLANIEIRRTLFWRFGGTAFIDAGNVFYNFHDYKFNRIELVGGLGLQFFTPIGPIRLDRGVKIQKRFDLADGATHLTILYAF